MTLAPLASCSLDTPIIDLTGLLCRQAHAFHVSAPHLASAVLGLVLQQNAMDKYGVYPSNKTFTNIGAPDYLQAVGIFSDLSPAVFTSLQRVTGKRASEEDISNASLNISCLDMIQLKIAAHSLRGEIEQLKETALDGYRSIGKSSEIRLKLAEDTLRTCLREDPSVTKLPELSAIAIELATTQPVTDHNLHDAREAIGEAPARSSALTSGGSHAPRKNLLRCYEH